MDLRSGECYRGEIARPSAKPGTVLARALLLARGAGTAHADPPVPTAAPAPGVPPGRPAADLDGVYVTIGFVGAAVHVAGDWYSGAGGEIGVVRVSERRLPAAIGLCGGGLSYAGRDGGRLWLEVEAAVERPLPFALGLGLGATAEVDPVRVPRLGFEATLWAFAGAIPYLRAGWQQESGTFVEIGLMVKAPIHIW